MEGLLACHGLRGFQHREALRISVAIYPFEARRREQYKLPRAAPAWEDSIQDGQTYWSQAAENVRLGWWNVQAVVSVIVVGVTRTNYMEVFLPSCFCHERLRLV